MNSINFNKKYIFWGLGVLVFIVLIILVSQYLYKTSPSYKVKATLKNEINYLKDKVTNLNASTYNYLMKSQKLTKNPNSKYTPKPITVNTDLNFDLSINKALDKSKNIKLSTAENLLNNSEIELKTNVDLDNKYIDGKLNYKHENEKVNLSYYVVDDDIYIYAKDFLDKYLNLNENDNEISKDIVHMLSSGLTYSDVYNLLTILSNTIDEIKISDKIVSSKTNIKIGTVSKETQKDSLNIDNELALRFTTKLISNIVNSQSALSAVNKIEGSQEVSETKEKLLEIYNGLKTGKISLFTQGRSMKMNIYMQGFFPEFLMQELEYNISDNLNGKFSFLKYNVDGYSSHFVVEQNGYNVALNTLAQNDNKNDLQLVIKKDNITSYIFDLTGILSAKNVNITYNLRSQNLNMCNGNFEYSQTFEKNEKQAKVKLYIDAQNIDFGKGEMDMLFKIKNINSVRQQEIKNEITYSELTENDISAIKVKMLKRIPTLYNLIK